MVQSSFVMRTQGKKGRTKYLLLTIAPSLLANSLLLYMGQIGILPTGPAWGLLCTAFTMSLMLVTGYFLIFQKNHWIEIRDQQIIETNWRGIQKSPIGIHQIHHVRKNFLNEIILLDENGKRLLCVEANMSNFSSFTQWLEAHHK